MLATMSSGRPTRPGSSGSHASSGRESTGTLKAKRSTMDKSKLALARDAYGWPAPAPASSANQVSCPACYVPLFDIEQPIVHHFALPVDEGSVEEGIQS